MNTSARDDLDDLSFFAIVTCDDGCWAVKEQKKLPESISDAESAVRSLRCPGPAFALINITDDFFIIVRPTPGGTKILLSDATMAAGDDADDLAINALDDMGADIPDDDDAFGDSWSEGDLDIFADLGISEEVMSVICDDEELWASEQLYRIACELGFDEEFTDALDLDLDINDDDDDDDDD